jgi:hypothetical protein
MERFFFAGEDERWEQPGRVPAGAIRSSGQENGFSPQRHLQVKRIRNDLFQIRIRPFSSLRIRIQPFNSFRIKVRVERKKERKKEHLFSQAQRN